LTLTNVTPEHGRRATGGFADVYKGRCLGEDVALKVFKIPLPSGVDSLNSWRSSDARFQNLIHEVFTWRQLSHSNVLPFYGVHFLEEPLEIRFCLVSPWMEHGNIVEFLVRRHRDGPYTDTTDCISLALDIANGVKYLHGERVIHRDLKGYNILISPSLRAYIADFGLATFTDSGSATVAGSAIMGTLKWLAPELIPHEVVKRHHTYASDIYAFALVCYEMFSGKVPFKNVQIDSLKLLLQRGERPPLPADDLSRRRGLSSEMEGVIRDCWAQEPTKRPSADKVVERLQLLRKHQDDQRPLDKIGTSFFTQLLRDQADNPFAILSKEYHGA